MGRSVEGSDDTVVPARSDSATLRAASRSSVVRVSPPAVTHSHRNVNIAPLYAQGQVFQGALQGSAHSSQGHTHLAQTAGCSAFCSVLCN